MSLDVESVYWVIRATRPIERCISCDEPTGNAGEGDDSIYIDGFGPFCDSCAEKQNSFEYSQPHES